MRILKTLFLGDVFREEDKEWFIRQGTHISGENEKGRQKWKYLDNEKELIDLGVWDRML